LAAILFYVCGALGSASGAVADLCRDGGAPGARGACGCAEGASCCGAACCAPAPQTPSCCLPEGAGPLDCCETEAEAAPPPAHLPVLTSGCTCGQRHPQSSPVHVYDAHLPSAVRAGICPPLVTHRRAAWSAQASCWRPEPRDRVPKAPDPSV